MYWYGEGVYTSPKHPQIVQNQFVWYWYEYDC